MDDRKFSVWKRWEERYTFANTKYPGVYAIALSDDDLTDRPFSLINNIVYFGMSNSRGGIRSRLSQFDNSLQDPPRHGPGHGGADRMKYKPDNRKYETVVNRLFVSVLPIPCDVKSIAPEDLRAKGLVTQLEYEYFAQYSGKYGHLPEFNDHIQSPKKYYRDVYKAQNKTENQI